MVETFLYFVILFPSQLVKAETTLDVFMPIFSYLSYYCMLPVEEFPPPPSFCYSLV